LIAETAKLDDVKVRRAMRLLIDRKVARADGERFGLSYQARRGETRGVRR
jgi:hypothetical protein